MNTAENSSYRICSKTVMDTSDSSITFDKDGVSNHWWEYKTREQIELISGTKGLEHAQGIANKIKAENKGGEYDCIIGLSGGVDSSYVAYWVRKLGLNPLAVHMDNGWNAELAVSNIEAIVKTLGIDLHTEVLDWPEFRDLQRSFFLSSVPNCEVPTDHSIVATLFKLAAKFGIRHIISGGNLVTEGVSYKNAGHDNKDYANIKDIHSQFGQVKLKSYPHLTPFRFAKSIVVDKLRFIPILNYLDYDKDVAIEVLKSEFGWKPYARKHGESTFTRFFQEYYLPQKFSIDKRRMHYSSLICSGQMTREQALELLEKPLYEPNELQRDIDYVMKKLQFSAAEFNSIMNAAPKAHSDYKIGLLYRSHDSILYRWGRAVATGRNKLAAPQPEHKKQVS